MFQLPVQLVRQRYLTRTASQPKFLQDTTLFEDFVVRCVRYAFASIPRDVARVFFSQWVSRPFLRWRMLRHGYLTSPVQWREYAHGEVLLDPCKLMSGR